MTAQTRKAEEDKVEEAPVPSPWGSADDPYGRTNHALSEDDVAQAAAKEGTLRPDGRARATVFYDDVLAQQAMQMRDFIESRQYEKKSEEKK